MFLPWTPNDGGPGRKAHLKGIRPFRHLNAKRSGRKPKAKPVWLSSGKQMFSHARWNNLAVPRPRDTPVRKRASEERLSIDYDESGLRDILVPEGLQEHEGSRFGLLGSPSEPNYGYTDDEYSSHTLSSCQGESLTPDLLSPEPEVRVSSGRVGAYKYAAQLWRRREVPAGFSTKPAPWFAKLYGAGPSLFRTKVLLLSRRNRALTLLVRINWLLWSLTGQLTQSTCSVTARQCAGASPNQITGWALPEALRCAGRRFSRSPFVL